MILDRFNGKRCNEGKKYGERKSWKLIATTNNNKLRELFDSNALTSTLATNQQQQKHNKTRR